MHEQKHRTLSTGNGFPKSKEVYGVSHPAAKLKVSKFLKNLNWEVLGHSDPFQGLRLGISHISRADEGVPWKKSACLGLKKCLWSWTLTNIKKMFKSLSYLDAFKVRKGKLCNKEITTTFLQWGEDRHVSEDSSLLTVGGFPLLISVTKLC